MSVPNFSFLAGLEVAEKFVVGGVGWGGGTSGYYIYTRRNWTQLKATLKQLALGFDNILIALIFSSLPVSE